MALDFHSYTPGQKQAIQTLDKPLFVAAGLLSQNVLFGH